MLEAANYRYSYVQPLVLVCRPGRKTGPQPHDSRRATAIQIYGVNNNRITVEKGRLSGRNKEAVFRPARNLKDIGVTNP